MEKVLGSVWEMGFAECSSALEKRPQGACRAKCL